MKEHSSYKKRNPDRYTERSRLPYTPQQCILYNLSLNFPMTLKGLDIEMETVLLFYLYRIAGPRVHSSVYLVSTSERCLRVDLILLFLFIWKYQHPVILNHHKQ